jgi:hypothetical protein
MKTLFLSMLLAFPVCMLHAQQNQITGKWRTVDDGDGKEKSIIEIYEESGKLHGKVVQLANTVKNPNCVKCEGSL